MTQPEGLEDLDSVEKVLEYKSKYADYSAILNRPDAMEVRVHYLKNLRSEWEILDKHTDEKHDNGFVLFRRKENQ